MENKLTAQEAKQRVATWLISDPETDNVKESVLSAIEFILAFADEFMDDAFDAATRNPKRNP